MIETRADELTRQDQEHVIHPLYHPDDHARPMIFVEGHGAILRDIEGNEYIDGLACLWNVNAGHGRAELAEAAAERQIVLLAGQAGDLGRLHAWLADLAAGDLFERAELVSLETGEGEGAAATFTARVVVCAAHGEPGGPGAALAAAGAGPSSVPSPGE